MKLLRIFKISAQEASKWSFPEALLEASNWSF
jgi:hypothetical protein